MNRCKNIIRVVVILTLCLFQHACTTDDIQPAIELTSNNAELSEANGTVEVIATLNSSSIGATTVPITFDGSATDGQDYTPSSNQIIIEDGDTSGSVILTGNQDEEIEGIETISVSLAGGSGFLVLSGAIEISMLDDDSDTDGDGILDANDDCPNTPGDVENNGCPFLGFLINEVLYDPPSGSPGDANNDGTRDPNEDEFIEFFNSGPELDLSGYTISDAEQIRHIFPQGTVLPVNGVLVVFGGGTPTGDFGGAIVQTASESVINMNNSGDFVTLADPSGNPVLTFDVEPLSNNPNESYTRNPDLTGEFVQHDQDIPEANGALYSPGTKLDGTSF
ncbi:lamin tail domain-containing protein [Flavobacteriaceae bacterium 14752]|uniref:lamin tail domain-containing protein n=1 Tax=Mesohalobacter salilacus TaxID=2491711 RepID=UPI000F62D6FA|nr:endonuclease [Flavobacteriaceae bacterium 14752]